MERRLTKSYSNKMISGVCGGLGKYFNLDPVIIRLVFVISTILGVGSPILIYIILAIVMPKS